jgi:hypothetical protein
MDELCDEIHSHRSLTLAVSKENLTETLQVAKESLSKEPVSAKRKRDDLAEKVSEKDLQEVQNFPSFP